MIRRSSGVLLFSPAVVVVLLAGCATKGGPVAEAPPAATPVASPIEPAAEPVPESEEKVVSPLEKLASNSRVEKTKPVPEKEKPAGAPAPVKPAVEQKKTPTELAKQAEDKVNWGSSRTSLQEAFSLSGEAADAAPTDSKIALQHARHALRLAQTETGIDRPAAVAKEGLASMKAAGIDGESNHADAAYYHASLTGMVMQAQGLGAAGKLPKLEAEFKRALGAPGTEQGGPLRAIGMLYLKAPPWPTGIGDIELALENLEKAVQSYGGFPHNHICLARAYADDGSLEEAEQSLDRAENLLASGNWGALESGWRREIAEIRKLIG